MANQIKYLPFAEINQKFTPPFDGALFLQLTQGYYTLIDADDFEKINHRSWSVRGRAAQMPYGYSGAGPIHRIIMDCPPHLVVDHINQNPLDNRKANLRLATKSQNAVNIKQKRNNKTSQYKGVSGANGQWLAHVTLGGAPLYLGSFKSEKKAAQAYDSAAAVVFGEFAVLNFPESQQEFIAVHRKIFKTMEMFLSTCSALR
jgi:hypothetical protein